MSEQITVIAARSFGFFSLFFHTVQHLYQAEIENRVPVVFWEKGLYLSREAARNKKRKENIWEYYFEPVSKHIAQEIDLKNSNVKVVCDYRKKSIGDEPEQCWDYHSYPPKPGLYNLSSECRHFVHQVIEKYVRVKAGILNEVDAFYNKHMAGHPIIGLHFRACTNCRPNQGTEPRRHREKAIKEQLDIYPDAKIFVATDREKALKNLKKKFGDRIIAHDCFRSKTEWQFDIANLQKKLAKPDGRVGPQQGREVLIDVLLLARSQCLIHGVSNVSAAVLYMNPDLPNIFYPYYSDADKKRFKKIGVNV